MRIRFHGQIRKAEELELGCSVYEKNASYGLARIFTETYV